MNYSDYRFTLDIHSTQSQVSVPVAFNDTARKLYISLSDGVRPYTIEEGCIATFVGYKPDGNSLFNSCIIENNRTIVYEFTPQTASAEGIVECEVRLYGANGQLITCPRFILVVDSRAVNGEVEVSESEKTAIDNIMLVEASRVTAENSRVNAEASRVSAEKSRVSAENIRKSSEASRVSAEQQRATAESLRASAETERADAEEERQAAEAARGEAEASRNAAVEARLSEMDEKLAQEDIAASERLAQIDTTLGEVSVRLTEAQVLCEDADESATSASSSALAAKASEDNAAALANDALLSATSATQQAANAIVSAENAKESEEKTKELADRAAAGLKGDDGFSIFTTATGYSLNYSEETGAGSMLDSMVYTAGRTVQVGDKIMDAAGTCVIVTGIRDIESVVGIKTLDFSFFGDLRGASGYTPVKGVDYFDGENGSRFFITDEALTNTIPPSYGNIAKSSLSLGSQVLSTEEIRKTDFIFSKADGKIAEVNYINGDTISYTVIFSTKGERGPGIFHTLVELTSETTYVSNIYTNIPGLPTEGPIIGDLLISTVGNRGMARVTEKSKGVYVEYICDMVV